MWNKLVFGDVYDICLQQRLQDRRRTESGATGGLRQSRPADPQCGRGLVRRRHSKALIAASSFPAGLLPAFFNYGDL